MNKKRKTGHPLVMKKKLIVRGCLFLTVLILCAAVGKKHSSEKIEHNLKENLIRFHVRANSNQKSDQAYKLKVRDAVIDYVSPYMESADTKEEALELLKKKKNGIQKTAEQTLKQYGVRQTVTVCFTEEEFPEKTYGDYTFPAGVYDAVRVNLGKAEGHNWWCVMFPDLCVTKDDEVEINEKAKEKMEKILGHYTVEKLQRSRYFGWLL